MTVWLWIAFLVLISGMIALDLGVFHRRAHVQTVTEATAWTTLWVVLALLFNGAVYLMYEHHVLGIGEVAGSDVGGEQAALQFFTAYVVEKSLSLDNIFVIAMIFAYFGVPRIYQHRVLIWGVLGAIVLRGVMIVLGTALIRRFEWITYVFGGLLLLTALKMLVTRHDSVAPERNPLVRFFRRLYPVSPGFHGDHFFARIDGKRAITPLFLVLLVVESSDVLFAVDSIPAVFAITQDPFIVFTSNIFAILGLRSLYFVLAGVMDRFRYLKVSLVIVLAFVGVKMLLAHHYPIPAPISLAAIGGILALGVIVSLLVGHRDGRALTSPLATDLEDIAGATWQHTRRVIILLLGASVLIIGLAMIVLPGPAFIVIPTGLAILGTEFLWARQLLTRMKRQGRSLLSVVFGRKPKDRAGASTGAEPGSASTAPPERR
jgi:tellurite resistance protein TerC